jgi:hypothetical protein
MLVQGPLLLSYDIYACPCTTADDMPGYRFGFQWHEWMLSIYVDLGD